MNTRIDERTRTIAQSWAARGMFILGMALSIDLLARILIFRQDPREYLDIALIWLAISVYVSIGMTASGIEPYEGKWSKSWLVVLVITITNTVVMTLIGRANSLTELVTILITSATGAFLAIIILRGIYRLWERTTLAGESREG